MPDPGRVRGFPLLQVIVVAVLFLAAGWPVWELTQPAPASARLVTDASAAQPTAIAAPNVPLALEASFAPAPASFQVRCLDQTVFEGRGPASRFSTQWKATVPKEGIDLVLRASWPAESGPGPTAARLVVQLPDGTKVDKSFWSAPGEALAQVVTVPGDSPAP